ncbi:MAG: sulfatase-like hydrolase/transferase [Saprospiraceae bacterium]|nr:sulfatase-like hydrolase/transferase [Saprospiraceae bacterium]
MHAFFALFLCLVTLSAPLWGQEAPTNVILIVVDDMRFDEWSGGGHPYLQTPNLDKLAEAGSNFTRAYHAVPLCSPNRASILTGQYPSRHGIVDNAARNQASLMLDLFPKYLQEAGYRTGHVGKWHMGNTAEPRPGFDYWLCLEGQGQTFDPILYEGTQRYQATGYITDILTEKALGFLEQNKEEPFFLYFAHKAIHPEVVQLDDGSSDLTTPKEFFPAPRHAGAYDTKTYGRSPSWSRTAKADDGKPVVQQAQRLRDAMLEANPELGNSMDIGVSESSIRRRAEMMLAVDESLGAIVAKLEALGIREQTAILFTSDNGYFFGEHGFSLERRMPYEESIKAPLIIHHPGVENPRHVVEGLAVSVDLAATVLDIAGLEPAPSVQGLSLIPLIQGAQTQIRPAVLVEYFSNENPFPWTAQLDYRVVVEPDYKYIKWLRFDQAELYQLSSDPYEQRNLIQDTRMQTTLTRLGKSLQQLQLKALGIYNTP